MNALLHELRQDYWCEAFRHGRRLGLTVDGLYDIKVDADIVLMYCGAPI